MKKLAILLAIAFCLTMFSCIGGGSGDSDVDTHKTEKIDDAK